MAAIARIRMPMRSSVLSTAVNLPSKPILNLKFQEKPVTPALSQLNSRSFTSAVSQRQKRYTEAHEWIELSEDGKIGTIGVSNYAAKSLGDVVYVELPTLGLEVDGGDSIGAVESVKSASDIYAPIAGTVVEANSLLEEKPATINQGAEAGGWIAKIEVKNKDDVMELMDSEAYNEHVKE